MNKDLDLLLIRLVKATPILYDKSKFSDYNEREVAWQKIGDKLHRPALECKERWMSMREFFRCTTLKTIVNKSSGQTTTRKPYKYHKELLFLVSHYKTGIVNIEDLENKGNEAKDDEEDDDFPVTFDIDGPDILNDVDELKDDESDNEADGAMNDVDDLKDDDEACNDIDNLKDDDDSESKEDDIMKTDNFSEGEQDQLEGDFESKVSKRKSNARKRKKAVNNCGKERVKTRIVELNPSNSTDSFLIDVRAKMKRLSRSKVDKVKSKIYRIISQYD